MPSESTNHASDAANYLPEGWSFNGTHLYLDGGFLSPGRNSVITANCDLVGYNKVSVIVKAKAYSKGVTTDLTVSTDEDSETLTLVKELDTYLVVLEVGNHGRISFTAGYYPEIQSIKIYGGEITDPEPFAFNATESGDAAYRLIEGITPDKFYNVTGLTAGISYLYRVKSVYVNGTESLWSNSREVLLQQGEGLNGDLDGDGRVNIDDVTFLIDYLTTGDASAINLAAADVDHDGVIRIEDVTYLIDILLGNAE